ncbi:MAG: von Willebrand factor type A domain-containing protein [Actinomycetota bacterium]|nr:von Willebrand factor type A domain-containing protein [Actinomycetota bacterium]
MRRHKRYATGLLAAVLVMASCSGDGDDATDPTSGRIDRPATTSAAAATTAAPSQTTAASSQPIAGGDPSAVGDASEDRSTREVTATTTAPATATFEDYGANPFEDPLEDEFSTFAVDVDTGSYTLMRAWINEGFLPDPDSVRVEEYVNYFEGGYTAPEGSTFAVYADGGPTPFWDTRNDILRIGIKAREVPERRRQDLNLTLVVDVSGSMSDQGKLEMVQDALDVLIAELDRFDTVAIVAYNTSAEVVLEPTRVSDSDEILDAIRSLSAGGSTNAEAGLMLGYDLADESFDRDAVNRVVLLSDGVANVGNTGPDEILERIGEATRKGIDLVTIGVGISTYNDVLLEQLADQGDGWYAYIDTVGEAERLFQDQLTTSLETVARDVKVQVEFDPDYVVEYRLVGFENRDLQDDDFRDDEVDAGDINAGHSVTALYDVALTRDAYRSDDAFATVRLRWTDADSGRVEEIEGDVRTNLLVDQFEDASPEFQLVSSVAAYAEVLRDSRWVRGLHLDEVLDEVESLPWRQLDDEAAEEFMGLVEEAVRLDR